MMLPLASIGCRKVVQIPTIHLAPATLSGEAMIRSWIMIGPFTVGEKEPETAGYSNGAAGLDHDYLASFGTHESSASLDDLATVAKYLGRPRRGETVETVRIDSEPELIEPTQHFEFGSYGVVYAAAQIVSASDSDVALQCSNTHGMKIWLNRENILTTGYSTGAQKLQHVLRVRLKRGGNFLLLKKTVIKDTPVGYGFPAGFSVGFSTIAYAKGLLKLVSQEMISDSMNGYWPYGRNVLAIGDELKISLPLYTGEPAEIEIADGSGEVVFSRKEPLFPGRWSKRVDGLREGIYRIRIRFPSDSQEDEFYVGDLDRLLAALKLRSAGFLRDETAKVNVGALLTRLATLIDFRKRAEPSMFQDPNIVYLISELEAVLSDLEKGREAFRRRPGTHIRGFRSRIDNQTRYYMVHAPSGDEDKPRPLVIVVPFTNERHPFLSSITVAQRQYAMMTACLADEYGYLVLWPHGRGVIETGSPIAMTDVMEALDAVKRDYPVDEERIYLAGFCSGGRSALLLAERYPSMFAAVAAWGPNRPRRENLLQQKWFDVNQPYALLENLLNIPVYAIQGKYDVDPSVQQTREFVDDARRIGVKVEYREIIDGSHIYFAVHPLPEFFNFFRGKSRQRAPSEVRLATGQLKYNEAQWIRITGLRDVMTAGRISAAVAPSGDVRVTTDNVTGYELLTSRMPIDRRRLFALWSDGRKVMANAADEIAAVGDPRGPEPGLFKTRALEGPVSDAFSDRFLLVAGSGGSAAERRAITALIARFRSAWRELFDCEFPFKTDHQVNSSDLVHANLILVGGAAVNSVSARVFGKLPLRADGSGLTIGDRRYNGNRLGFQAVLPNPLNPGRYVVILAETGAANYYFQNEWAVLNGWYDFVVWRPTESGGAKIVDIGYFDSHWKRAISCIGPGMEEALTWPWKADKGKQLGLANL